MQSEKALLPIDVTFSGIRTSVKPLQLSKADSPMRSRLPGSVTFFNRGRSKKARFPIEVTPPESRERKELCYKHAKVQVGKCSRLPSLRPQRNGSHFKIEVHSIDCSLFKGIPLEKKIRQ